MVAGTLAHLCVGDGLQLGCPELPQLLLVLPQVCLAANENHGGPSAEMCHFREPLSREKAGYQGRGHSGAAPTLSGRQDFTLMRTLS